MRDPCQRHLPSCGRSPTAAATVVARSRSASNKVVRNNLNGNRNGTVDDDNHLVAKLTAFTGSGFRADTDRPFTRSRQVQHVGHKPRVVHVYVLPVSCRAGFINGRESDPVAAEVEQRRTRLGRAWRNPIEHCRQQYCLSRRQNWRGRCTCSRGLPVYVVLGDDRATA